MNWIGLHWNVISTSAQNKKQLEQNHTIYFQNVSIIQDIARLFTAVTVFISLIQVIM
jgi:hypothetical protein